jgi:hypothetical protein
MKQLEKQFIGRGQVKGFIFTQIKKSEKAYIYKVDTGTSTHYEVFRHRENTQYNCVSYPSNKQFGITAWSCSNLDKAIERFEGLN